MTIAQLKQSMDRRFDRLQRAKADKRDLRKLRNDVRNDIRLSHAETRRHFDIVAESLRDDIRILAEGVAGHSHRLTNHETRITRLEQRP